MFIIKNTVTGRIHKEPSRARTGYRGGEYASERAAKAGVTRTLKHYAKAIEQVRERVAAGEPEYMAPMYNDYREVTEPCLNRQWVNDPNTYEVMTKASYGDPQQTDTGVCPFNGKTITRTISVNDAWGHMDPLCESHWTR
jgi:hypothetical protein|tara:strand:- start:755 stop:1174 length:420 start_codon:yes stop_codon:yes gene_type:complete